MQYKTIVSGNAGLYPSKQYLIGLKNKQMKFDRNAFYKEDWSDSNSVDPPVGNLTQFDFKEKKTVFGEGFDKIPVAVQLLKIVNVAIPQKQQQEHLSESENSQEEEEAFSSKYLDNDQTNST